MAKRFIDTGYYKSPFVRSLKGSLKSLYCFIICDCNGAGIWAKDLEIASMYIGLEISEKEFNVFIEKNKAIDLKNGKYFFPDFLDHQYPKGLSLHNPAQKNFIIELQRNSLIDSDLKPLWSTLEGTKVKVMEKVEVKEIGNSLENVFNFKKSLLDFGFNEKLVEEWLKVRKTKKATNTETAFNKFINQVNLCPMEKNKVLEECIVKSWSGFEASWITGKENKSIKSETKDLTWP